MELEDYEVDILGIGMSKDYDERLVDNYSENGIVVDTVRVTDSPMPYETGVKHPDYSNRDWIIVDTYPTKEEAQIGHNKWVNIMTTEPLPDELIDKSLAYAAKMCDTLGDEWRIKKRMKRVFNI